MTKSKSAAFSKISDFQPSFLIQIVSLFGILFLATAIRLFLIDHKGFEIFGAEVAIFGLMGKHILEGEWMTFVYGQGYTGALEGYLSALFFILRGIHIESVYFASVTVYAAFLSAHYFLIRKVFSWLAAVFSTLWLAVSPWQLTWNSVYTNGGYVGAMFFGSLFLYAVSERKKFWAGIFLGMAIWTQNVGGLYALCLLLYLGFQNPETLKQIRKNIWNFLRVRISSLFIPLRWFFLFIHVIIAIYCLLSLCAVFYSGSHIAFGNLTIPLPTTPFYMKKIKLIVAVLVLEGFVLLCASKGIRFFKEQIQKWKLLGFGFLLGYSPVLIHLLRGAPYGNYERFSDLGVIRLKDFIPHLIFHIREGFWQGILGVCEAAWIFGSLSRFSSWVVFILTLGFLFLGVVHFLNRKKKPWNSRMLYPWIFCGIYLLLCLSVDVHAERYYVPFFHGISLLIAFGVLFLRQAWGRRVYFLFAILITGQGINNYFYIRSIPDKTLLKADYQNVLEELRSKNILGGYAENHRIATALTFLSREERKIVFIHSKAQIYPDHNQFVENLSDVVYIFQRHLPKGTAFEEGLKQKGIHYQRNDLNELTLYYLKN